MIKKVHYNKGFTLVEMIVSLGIFTIVALVAVGALIKIMDANKKSIALKTSINNLNFTLESMSREMRVGKNYRCCDSIGYIDPATNNLTPTSYSYSAGPQSDWIIAFNSSKRDQNNICNLVYAYKFVFDAVSQTGKLSKAQQKDCYQDIGLYNDLVSPEIKIDRSMVTVDNKNQPYATFFFHGISGVREREQSEVSIQTSVSQRLPK